MYEIFEWLVVGAALAFSVVKIVRTLAPHSARVLSRGLRRAGVPATVADSLAPAAPACDDGCSVCDKCGPSPADRPQVIIVRKTPRQEN